MFDPHPTAPDTNGWVQTKLMLRKNFLLKKRFKWRTAAEVFLPAIMMFALIIGYTQTEIEENQARIPALELDVLVSSLLDPANTALSDITGDSTLEDIIIPLIQDAQAGGTGNTTIDVSQLFEAAPTLLPSLTNLTSYSGPIATPSMDGFIALGSIVGALLDNSTLSSQLDFLVQFAGEYQNILNLGRLAFAPDNQVVRDLITYMSSNSLLFPTVFDKIYETEEDLVNYVRSQEGANTLWAGIIIDGADDHSFNYTIRMNSTSLTDTTVVLTDSEGLGNGWRTYVYSGFLTLQAAIEDFAVERATGERSIRITTIPFPVKAYTSNPFYALVGSLLGLFICMAYVYPMSRLVKGIVEEKEVRQKETMLMMGLRYWVFSSTWFLTYFVLFSVSALAVALILNWNVLYYSDFGLVFLYFWLYSMSLITFGMLLSVFFSKSKLASTVAPLITFASMMPRYAFPADLSVQPTERLLASLLSPVAFSFGADVFADLEGDKVGVTWDTITQGDLTMSTVLLMILLDFFIYGFLSWYLDKVLPTEFGLPLSPIFFLKPSYWCGSSEVEEQRSGAVDDLSDFEDMNEDVEAVVDSVKQRLSVSVRGLFRSFKIPDGEMVAVNSLSLNLYEGQITALLGHNGAGKTTTISMLTGLIPQTKGDALVYGRKMSKHMPEIRKIMGVCPQHNVLYDHLTCREHLELYAALKGVPEEAIEKEVKEMIDDVGLTEKIDTFSLALSGGMKRKLSVAIALIGGSKIVFLDEPTSGMDPYSRRATWQLLQKNKEGRTIVLTTHFMDEADLLGDRIAIMSKGELRCCGSSLFLKSKYGVGYNMTLVKEPSCKPEEVKSLVKTYVPDSETVSNVGSEMVIQLPLKSVKHFADMFREVDQKKESMGIQTFGISVTTLEEVFLRLAEHKNDEVTSDVRTKDRQVAQELQRRRSSLEMTLELDDTIRATQKHTIRHENMFWIGVGTTIKKRYLTTKRDLRNLCLNLIMPVMTILLSLVLLNLNFELDQPPIALNINTQYPFDMETFWTDNDPTPHPNDKILPDLEAATTTSNYTALGAMNSTSLSYKLLDEIWEHEGSLRLAALVFDDSLEANSQTLGEQSFDTALSLMHNTSAPHIIPTFMTAINDANIRAVDPANRGIALNSHPWPLTEQQDQQVDAILTIFAALFVLIPYCFIPANFVVFVVKERASKVKHQLEVSGLNMYAYWIGTYLWDICTYMVTVLCTLILFAVFQEEEFVGNGPNFLGTVLLFLLYGMSCIPLSYLLSRYFSNPSSTQSVLALAYFIVGFVLVITSFILDLLDNTKDANATLKYIYRLFPPYSLGQGMISQSQMGLLSLISNEEKTALDWDVLGMPLVYMAVEAVVFFSLTLAVEAGMIEKAREILSKYARRQGNGLLDDQPPEDEDDDVTKERERVAEISSSDDSVIVKVDSLRKVYAPQGVETKPKVAVKNLSFALEEMECFGLLGVNGAGKTTTLSILSGEFPPTSGQATMNGHDVVTEKRLIRSELGYCPQFDALLDLMTGREHLMMYASIKGFAPEHRKQVVEAVLKKLSLDIHADKTAGSYSGGNKRKLMVAVALLGDPSVVLLDEPSTGMDPQARRFMWNVISSTMRGRSVILTTHSMEECEALCNRIGIMVGGKFRCLGPAQHLKNKFGDGYFLELKTRETSEVGLKTVRDFVTSSFPGAHLSEFHAGQYKFDLPAVSTSLSEVFAAVEDNRDKLDIEDYCLSQTTLEQVFLAMAKQQHDDEDTATTQMAPGLVMYDEEEEKPRQDTEVV